MSQIIDNFNLPADAKPGPNCGVTAPESAHSVLSMMKTVSSYTDSIIFAIVNTSKYCVSFRKMIGKKSSEFILTMKTSQKIRSI